MSAFGRSLLALLALALPLPVVAQGGTAEQAAAAALQEVAGNGARLRLFLQAMPKGGDLHNHLEGAIYAEDFLAAAAAKGLCADEAITRVVAAPCPPERQIATMAQRDPFTYARLVDALSTRGFQQGIGPELVSGHDQFFATFARFRLAAQGDYPRWLAQAYASAGRGQLTYLELMYNPSSLSPFLAAAPQEPLTADGLAAAYRRDRPEVEALLDAAMAEVTRDDAAARALLGCDGGDPDPGCGVAVRYLHSGLRGLPPQNAWRSLLAGFALADRDPRYVGVNIVMPEDDPVALRDYDLHMAMFRFLQERYPDVNVTMHAGELALGLVPPASLEDHIAKAVAAGAQRIGHGVDIAYETAAPATMARMAAEGIPVEINLTSNAVILGVEGGDHPLHLYRAHGVPVMLSTDDEGVLRSDMTNEYMRAVREQGLDYADLKQLARNSLQYAFVPGDSLWAAPDYTAMVQPCSRGLDTQGCRAFLAASEKAALQARLETEYARFEATIEQDAQPGTVGS